MNQDTFNAGLIDFLNVATSPFHAVEVMVEQLETLGFSTAESVESIKAGGAGVYTRRGGSLIALAPGSKPLAESGLRMVGAHTDSPCLMVKPNAEQVSAGYLQLGVEVYGGALLNPWFDRDLSLAGRVSYVNKDGDLATALVDFRRAIATIPSLAIHLDREANTNRSVNAQTQMAPILAIDSEQGFSLRDFLRDTLVAGNAPDCAEVLDYELCFYDTQPAAMSGLSADFLASARLDNLLSCYIGLQALTASDDDEWRLLVCNDHEEVGSLSASGAQGPMLRQFLDSLCTPELTLNQLMQRSMMISADNAHGIHPNFKDKHDAQHGPMLNGGPVIKINANQRYASASDGAALFRLLARRAGVPVQSFVMRADMACGSTIGPITAGELGVATLDIGVPTLAMHSIRELAGSADAHGLVQILLEYFRQPGPLLSTI